MSSIVKLTSKVSIAIFSAPVGCNPESREPVDMLPRKLFTVVTLSIVPVEAIASVMLFISDVMLRVMLFIVVMLF